MRREAPDTRFYSEIKDLNVEFLALVAAARDRCHGPVFGLDSAVVEHIGRLAPAQLEAMAETPCLLAGFAAARAPRFDSRVAEPAPVSDPQWTGRARLFAAGLLTYAWQVARRDSLRAALCIGPSAAALAGDTSFRDIRGYADRALLHLEARFRRSHRFWPDLVRAGREGHPERLQLARLTAIQLATAELRGARAATGAAAPVAVTR
jgi:hypothetical protein